MIMETENRTREELIRELETLHLDFDRINESYQKDIAERKNAEQELRNSLSLVEATLESE
jgi:hypothetical protein